MAPTTSPNRRQRPQRATAALARSRPALKGLVGGSVLGLLLLASVPLASARPLHYGCACVGTPWSADCAKPGGASGSHGWIMDDVAAAEVLARYTPTPIGTVEDAAATRMFPSPWTLSGQASGWFCLPQGSYACACAGQPGRPNCGNGAVAGFSGDSHVTLSLADVLKNYGPGRIGAERTGWVCVLTDLPDGP